MTRIDAHHHLWNYDPARHGWIDERMSALRRDFRAEDLLPELRANGIDSTVLVQVDQTEAETAFLLQQAVQNPWIKGVVGWVDLRATNLTRRLQDFVQFPALRGFRHIAQAEPDDFLVREDFVRGVAMLREFGYTYDILIYPQQMRAAVELVEKLPEQTFVLDHIAKPRIAAREIDEWAAGIRALAANPRVYCKVSGMITEADWSGWRADDFKPYLDVVFEAFGADRLMFGSDWPVCLVAGSYAQVKAIVEDYARGLDVEKLFGGNAARCYGLTNGS